MIDNDLKPRRIAGLIIGIILILCFLAVCTTSAKAQTKSEVYDYIIASDIQEPQIVFKQVLKETGHLKCSDCSLDRNNLFGFWDGTKYLEFESWERSIDYYENWQIRKGYDGKENYYDFLIRKWGAPKMVERYIPTLKQVKL